MVKINLEKFICDFLTHKGGNIYDNIKYTLNDQGLEYTRDGEIVEIDTPDVKEETKHKYKDLEVSPIVRKALEENGDYTNYRPDVYAARVGATVESMLRNQIAEEVPVDDMSERFLMNLNNRASLQDIYKKGILDTLEKIKGSKIL